ncbi:MAG TPA: SDR family NAD(P)-dependent oxidoreductase, partial [Ramlibacter sp.]
VALHRAVLSVQHEGCDMAIAGGANLLITPDMHIMYSKVGMLAEDGRCKTFSAAANGYVRSDGVGAVLVKTLRRAEQDGDTILAVIRGSAENHGGMATSLTAPNPKAQASLVVEAHRRAGIDPRSIGYLECHGTGTSLGDPIEVNGLKLAFAELHAQAGLPAPAQPYCGIGSIKSNIGHAETAAGIAGVIKTVLSLRHAQLYPTLHSAPRNPLVGLDGSPFYVLDEGRAWQRPVVDGVEQPRRAGVSSFGAGGSNAHLVLEEYVAPARAATPDGPQLILLSARTSAQLAQRAQDLLAFLDAPGAELADIALTLQVGRDAMAERAAWVSDSIAQLRRQLAAVAADEAIEDGERARVRRGQAEAAVSEPNELRRLWRDGAWAELARLWLAGTTIDWASLQASAPVPGARRIALPTYPFARQRHWLPGANPHAPRRSRGAQVEAPLPHPMLHARADEADGVAFTSRFTGTEFFLADHQVAGRRVMPGAGYLEMARAAAEAGRPAAAAKLPVLRLQQVVWASPYVAGEVPAPLQVRVTPIDNDRLRWRVASGEASDHLHSQGVASFAPAPAAPPRLDLDRLRQALGGQELAGADCYDAFRAMGLAYGPGHQGLQRVIASAPGTTPQVLAQLKLPPTAGTYALHPGLLDAALQACIGFLPATGRALPAAGQASSDAALPFALDELELLAPLPTQAWAWLRHAAGSAPGAKVEKVDIDVCDADGVVCVRLRGFSSRRAEAATAAPDASWRTLVCRPVWEREDARLAIGDAPAVEQHLVVCDVDGRFPSNLQQLLGPDWRVQRLALDAEPTSACRTAALAVLRLLQQAGVAVQVLVPADGAGGVLAGLSGMLLSAQRENPRLRAQLIACDAQAAGGPLADLLAQDRRVADQRIRYRHGAREVLHWREHAVVEDAEPAPVPWKDDGVYLISGGAGGLGLQLARRIGAQTRRACVVLCGRSAPSEAIAAAMAELRGLGLRAKYRQVDVTRASEVAVLVREVLATHGRIDGVVHAAGLLRDNYLARKSADEVAAVLAPKLDGAVHLDRATAGLPLDFFLLFSSAAGAWGSAAQADYAAANAFMDAWAAQRTGAGRTLSVAWPLWAEGGMRMPEAGQRLMAETTGMHPLPMAQGWAALEQALAGDATQLLVLHGDASRLRKLLAQPLPVAVAPAAPVAEPAAGSDAGWMAQVQRALLAGLRRSVSEQMKFALDEVEPEGEWNDYGFDSITLTEFANRLNGQWGLELTPTVFFEHGTLDALAQALAREHAATVAPRLGVERATAPPVAPVAAMAAVAATTAPASAAPEAAQVPPPARSGYEDDTIVIVGASGSFPGASDLDAFWRQLAAGADCIGEIPADRWDWKAWFGGPDEPNKTSIKWGGFIEGAGDFDARFFGISPREAIWMDPAQRLLLLHAWRAIEDAGQAPGSLAGTRTAVFVGTAPSGYAERLAAAGNRIASHSSTGAVGSIGANRISYFLDLHGPSEPIETACSSALVAVHRGVMAIRGGDCDQALVGGINLIISPETQVSFGKAGMLSEDGRCKTFSKNANGYVRGEGVGLLFLKRLGDARRDGNPILAVIRGSAENHGGRANSLTAPNPKAQADLLRDAYRRAGVDPRTVGYIEAHGTGTALGDPIEVQALKTAFRDLAPQAASVAPWCGIGSVKTNIGHLELAAGAAGMAKVLLQLRHRTLAPTLHCGEVNPFLQIEGSPFYLVRQAQPWAALRDADGRELPRRAGVSSFGFGGVNAHVVLEEYVAGEATPAIDPNAPQLLVLSARNPDRLQAQARQLLAFLESASTEPVPGAVPSSLLAPLREEAAALLSVPPAQLDADVALEDYGFERVHRAMLQARMQELLERELAPQPFLREQTLAGLASALQPQAARETVPALPPLAAIACTLQLGRDAMEDRLALVATTHAQVAAKLRAYLADTDGAVQVGNIRQGKATLAALGDGDEIAELTAGWIARGQLERIAGLWVQGLPVDWALLHGGRPLQRVRLPTYPFAGQRFWFDAAPAGEVAVAAPVPKQLHPLVHQDQSTAGAMRLGVLLRGDEFFLADHRVQGRKVLPGVAYLEMARAAATIVRPHAWPHGVRVHDVAWLRPAVADEPLPLEIAFTPGAGETLAFVVSGSGASGERVVHSEGRVSRLAAAATLPRLDPAAAARLPTVVDADTCYAQFRAAGLDYGPAHRCIVTLHAGPSQAWARLQLAPALAAGIHDYVLHPGLLDAALQASIGVGLATGAASGASRLSLPFAVDAVDVLRPCSSSMWAWVRTPAGAQPNARVRKLDIDLCEDDGTVCVQIRGFSTRMVDVPAPAVVATAPDTAVLKSRTLLHFRELL